jgi:hypothetical protein
MNTKPTIEYAGISTFHGDKEPSYVNFFPNPWGVKQYGHEKIYEVIVREPKDGEKPKYWSWWDEEKQRFELTYAKELLLDMCFAYGTDCEEKAGKGKKVRTVADLIREIPLTDVDKVSKEACERIKREKVQPPTPNVGSP